MSWHNVARTVGIIAVALAVSVDTNVGAQRPSTCRVICSDRDSARSLGTGCLVSTGRTGQYAIIFTAAHVVQDARSITAKFPFAPGQPQVRCRLTHFDRTSDRAVLWCPAPVGVSPAYISSDYELGDTCSLEGFAGSPGDGNTQQQFRAVQTKITRDDLRYSGPATILQLAYQSRQGDSGGPVYDEDGRLLAVISRAGHGRTLAPLASEVFDRTTDDGLTTWCQYSVCPPGGTCPPNYATRQPANIGQGTIIAQGPQPTPGHVDPPPAPRPAAPQLAPPKPTPPAAETTPAPRSGSIVESRAGKQITRTVDMGGDLVPDVSSQNAIDMDELATTIADRLRGERDGVQNEVAQLTASKRSHAEQLNRHEAWLQRLDKRIADNDSMTQHQMKQIEQIENASFRVEIVKPDGRVVTGRVHSNRRNGLLRLVFPQDVK